MLGGIAYQITSKQNQKVQKLVEENIILPSQPPQLIPSTDETVYTESDRSANWKTYSFNDEFSFKYPPDWKVGDLESICCSYVSNPATLYPSQSEGTLRVEGVYNESCKNELSGKNLETTFAGFPASIIEKEYAAVDPFDIKSPPHKQKTIFVNKGNACYTLVYSSISSNTTQKQTLDQILSTFRFLK